MKLNHISNAVLENGKNIDMRKICGCSCAETLDDCEKKCKKYYDCHDMALANDILLAYEKDKDEPLEDNYSEFIGQIIDVFEDFLEEKNIYIPNNEQDDEDTAACIYGSDYFFLKEKIKETLINWNVIHLDDV